MKFNLPKISNIRFYVNIVSILGLAGFFVFFPILGPVPVKPQPSVKSAFVSEPPLPVSKNILPPELTATGIFVSDINTGVVLFEKNPHQKLKPASLTKIMTALVALDYYDQDTILTVKNGESSQGSTAKLQKGDKLITSDLLYALLVPSGNDAALTLAENYPGGYQAFVARMNSKATEMGLSDTHFVNVSGVESSNHYTTAFDIATIARSALERPQFAQIVSTQKVTIKSLKGNFYPLETTNVLLGEPGIYGVKTGWTPEAGECLVILAERDNHQVIISLLNSKDRFGEAQKIFDWVFTNFNWE